MTGVFTGSSVGEENEVVAKATRRRFTAAYKRRILEEADRCTKPGEVGALLRREGLYSSHLTAWRVARARGELSGKGVQRGPVPKPRASDAKRIRALEREARRCRARAERAEALVEVQKKGSSRISGKRRTDLEEEIGVVPEAVRHPLDDFDLVVDAFEHAGVERILTVRQDAP